MTESRKAYMRQWRRDNRLSIQDYQRHWRADNREYLREYNRQWRQANKGCIAKSQAKYWTRIANNQVTTEPIEEDTP